MEKVAIGQAFFQATRFHPVSIISPTFHTLISFIQYTRYIILVNNSVVKRNTSLPSLFILGRNSPARSQAASVFRFQGHTKNTRALSRQDSSQRVISSSHRSLIQHTRRKGHQNPCPQQYSNLRSQQSSDCTATCIGPFYIQSGPKKCIHSLLINIFGINLNEISISLYYTLTLKQKFHLNLFQRY